MADERRERPSAVERTLHIAFDVSPELFAATGVARYSRELGRALDRRDDCELHRIAIGRRTEAVPQHTAHLQIPLRAVHLAWTSLGMPRAETLAGPVDVVHSLDLLPPPTRLPLVVTMHDLVAIERPDLHTRRAVKLQRQRVESLARASVVLCVSRSTADGLVARGTDPSRISVVPLGLTALPPAVDPPIPAGPFVLAVGTLEPRKGHEVMLRAFASAGLDRHHVVLAGPTADRPNELASLAQDLGIKDRLTILGPVNDAVLAGLYRNASVLCLPSLAEGFGLPVLEAMSLGVPVVASDLDSVREVAGGSAVLVPPGSVDSLARGLVRVLADAGLRSRMQRSGAARAARFRWETVAEATVAAYRRALRETAERGARALA